MTSDLVSAPSAGLPMKNLVATEVVSLAEGRKTISVKLHILNYRLIHRITQLVGAGTDGLVLRHWHLISVRCPSTELLRWTCNFARQGSGR